MSGLNNSIQTLTQTISCHPVENAGGGGKPEAHEKKADKSLAAIADRAVTTPLKLNEESTTLINEIKSIKGPAESICKMIEECDRKFEENIESIARMHEPPMRKNKPRKNMI